jgi:glycosyltransferase involved in cell wall biosynthesis
MKILMVSDFSIEQNPGGAQVSNNAVIEEGRKLGHEINLMTVTSSPTLLLAHYDLLISSNLEAINQKDSSGYVVNRIITHHRHVRLEHDSCHYLSPEIRQKLFESTKASFFLSDFHIDFFRDLYGDYFENTFVVYDPIDSEVFYEQPTTKIHDIVYCGYLHPLKGLGNLVRFARDNPLRRISVFGWPTNAGEAVKKESTNIEFKGKLSHSETAEVFRSAQAIYHSPQVREPFCRMIGEALMCGIEEVLGDQRKIGSYMEFKKHGKDIFRDRCNNAASIFWRHIESICNE